MVWGGDNTIWRDGFDREEFDLFMRVALCETEAKLRLMKVCHVLQRLKHKCLSPNTLKRNDWSYYTDLPGVYCIFPQVVYYLCELVSSELMYALLWHKTWGFLGANINTKTELGASRILLSLGLKDERSIFQHPKYDFAGSTDNVLYKQRMISFINIQSKPCHRKMQEQISEIEWKSVQYPIVITVFGSFSVHQMVIQQPQLSLVQTAFSKNAVWWLWYH